MREDFNAEHGAHIPADICLCIENPPTRWEVVPWTGDMREVLPDIDADLLTQVSPSVVTFLPPSFSKVAGVDEKGGHDRWRWIGLDLADCIFVSFL
jgi:hypothetical protein